MKKLIFFLFTFAVLSGYINSQSITVTNPDGSVWKIGKPCEVKWTKIGVMHKYVKLRLYEKTGKDKKFDITDSTPNNGSYLWTIPGSVPEGEYVLRVKTIDNNFSDNSVPFFIKKPSSQSSSGSAQKSDDNKIYELKKIEITSPAKTSKWKEGGSYKIQWKNEFVQNRSLKISLYDGAGIKYIKTLATILASNVTNAVKTGSRSLGISTYNWYIAKGTFEFPGKFRIKIRSTDGKATGMSEKFAIEIVPKVSKYKIYGVVNNQCKRKLWVASGSTDHLKSQADKVPCKQYTDKEAWVGYSYRLMHVNKSSYVGDVFRSFVYFEFGHFKNKGVVLSAKLKYSESDVSSAGDCKISVFKVNSIWTDPFKVNSDFLSSDPKNIDLKTVVWSWIGHAEENYGLMFKGPDESFKHISAECRTILRDIYIEVEFLESK